MSNRVLYVIIRVVLVEQPFDRQFLNNHNFTKK